MDEISPALKWVKVVVQRTEGEVVAIDSKQRNGSGLGAQQKKCQFAPVTGHQQLDAFPGLTTLTSTIGAGAVAEIASAPDPQVGVIKFGPLGEPVPSARVRVGQGEG